MEILLDTFPKIRAYIKRTRQIKNYILPNGREIVTEETNSMLAYILHGIESDVLKNTLISIYSSFRDIKGVELYGVLVFYSTPIGDWIEERIGKVELNKTKALTDISFDCFNNQTVAIITLPFAVNEYTPLSEREKDEIDDEEEQSDESDDDLYEEMDEEEMEDFDLADLEEMGEDEEDSEADMDEEEDEEDDEYFDEDEEE